MDLEDENQADTEDPPGELGPGWESVPCDHGDGWRALIQLRYPATVAPVTTPEGVHGFAVILDGELLEGPDPSRRFLFATPYEAAVAAEQRAQSRACGWQREPRYRGMWGNGADTSDHDDVVRKWLHALTRS